MADVQPVLLGMLEAVASALGPDLLARTVFVGGATTGLFVTDDFTLRDVRLTEDVDLIVDIMGHGDWGAFEALLRAKGFVNDQNGPVCRMLLDGLKVDFMPDDAAILGFTNQWYAHGLETATEYKLSAAHTIRLLTPAVFVATKLEAYMGRGEGDLLSSQDLEDILITLDGRKELGPEIKLAMQDVQDYIAAQLSDLQKHDDFEAFVSGNLQGDQDRIDLVYERIQSIIG